MIIYFSKDYWIPCREILGQDLIRVSHAIVLFLYNVGRLGHIILYILNNYLYRYHKVSTYIKCTRLLKNPQYGAFFQKLGYLLFDSNAYRTIEIARINKIVPGNEQ